MIIEKFDTLTNIFNNYAVNIDVEIFEINRGTNGLIWHLYNPPHRDNLFTVEFRNHPVHLKPYKMNVKWTRESAEDMKVFFNLKVEEGFIKTVSEEMILNENK